MTPEEYFKQAKQTLQLPNTVQLCDAYQFGDQADALAKLVVNGEKTATTSSYDLYEPDEQLPFVGEYDVILNAKDQPVCVTRTDKVEIKTYLDVTKSHAFNEGEGDKSLTYWRRVHNEFFTKEYASVGQKFDPQTAKMVLETFHVIYP